MPGTEKESGPETPRQIQLLIARRSSHPWIFQKMVQKPAGRLPGGAVVDIVQRDGQWVGRGFYNGHSRIALRVLTADDVPGRNLFGTIAPNGLLLTQDWQVASPMLYAQEIEQRRGDVKVVDINLLRRSWYFDYLQHAYPDLIERSSGNCTFWPK